MPYDRFGQSRVPAVSPLQPYLDSPAGRLAWVGSLGLHLLATFVLLAVLNPASLSTRSNAPSPEIIRTAQIVLVLPTENPPQLDQGETLSRLQEGLTPELSDSKNRSAEFDLNPTKIQTDPEVLQGIPTDLPPVSLADPKLEERPLRSATTDLQTGPQSGSILWSPSLSAGTISPAAQTQAGALQQSITRFRELDPSKLETERALVQSRLPRGESTSFSLFGGPPISGRKFVFVLDRSASMDSTAGLLMKLSSRELIQAFEALNEDHDFQIIIYNQKTSTLRPPDLLPASDENKVRAIPFLQTLPSSGGTDHLGALYHAISYRPDAILLFSDGGEPFLTDEALRQIRSQTETTIQIHCFEFGMGVRSADQDSGFMKSLAAQTGGTYLYIDLAVVSK